MMMIPHEELETKESSRLKTCCCCLITKGRNNEECGEARVDGREDIGLVQGVDNLLGIFVFIFQFDTVGKDR